MFDRTIAAALTALLLTACASGPEQSADAREQKYYRTGSNIPTRDYGAGPIEVGKPGVADSMNRPMGNISNKKPGG
jgi:ABC-type oligopeptide transport system substrate-binding subunit